VNKWWICAPLLSVLLTGCDRNMKASPVDMWNRSRYKPLEPSTFFPDGSSSRTIPVGTVARGQLRIDETLYAGRKRGTGVAPADMDYGYLGNGGNIGGIFNGAGAAGTGNNLQRDGDLSGNGEGRATSGGGRGTSVLSGDNNTTAGAMGSMAANSGTQGGATTPGPQGGTALNSGANATSNRVGASVGGDGINRAVGDDGLGNAANLATEFPFPITQQLLSRGQERYNINCTPCHGASGEGNGIIVQRGFPAPPSFHIPRLENAPVGHYFDVISHGYGAMYSYASRVEPRDRWAIIAYIRLLQQSRKASGVKSTQYDTPRSYPSPGATKMTGSNRPGMSTSGAKTPRTSQKVRPNNDRIVQNNMRGTATR